MCWQLLKSNREESHIPRGARLYTQGTLHHVIRWILWDVCDRGNKIIVYLFVTSCHMMWTHNGELAIPGVARLGCTGSVASCDGSVNRLEFYCCHFRFPAGRLSRQGDEGTILKSWTCNDHNQGLSFYDTNQPVNSCREGQVSIRYARCIIAGNRWLNTIES